MIPEIRLHIAGEWRGASGRRTIPVINPATEEEIGRVPMAEASDLDDAVAAADRGFRAWRRTTALERYRILRKAAELLAARAQTIAPFLTAELGRPLPDAIGEIMVASEIIDWFAEEARRAYGRVIPARMPNVHQMTIKEPVGPVAAFATWNVPVNHVVRKVGAALAAGCSVIMKGPEETPVSSMMAVQAFLDAGVPPDALGLVYGVPEEVSNFLIPHPVIRKITFTGSTPVGKKLAAMAGAHMKRVTMELGGHAPAIICADADLDLAARVLAGTKFRNAGQICISPSRFLVHESVHDAFIDRLVDIAKGLKIGNGMEAGIGIGPLANRRRLEAMENLVTDAVARGATVRLGGRRVGNKGFFFEPTVLTDVPLDALAMNDEPFGPVVLARRFSNLDEAVAEANRLPYGLAAYAYTRSAATAGALADGIESGMVSINHHGLGPPETPFGGVKDSGYGSEGGSEAIDNFMVAKFVSQAF